LCFLSRRGPSPSIRPGFTALPLYLSVPSRSSQSSVGTTPLSHPSVNRPAATQPHSTLEGRQFGGMWGRVPWVLARWVLECWSVLQELGFQMQNPRPLL
jgi:hypothetical protein